MTQIEVGEGIETSLWPPLPVKDRLLVGGTTVWLGPFDIPLLVAQPNRWGMVEEAFPAVACLVETDPLIAGLLPQPANVVGWVDRAHRPIEPPKATGEGQTTIDAAGRLAKMIDQIKGVRLIARPQGRTVVFTTPLEAPDLIAKCRPKLAGLRQLDGLAGAVAVVVAPSHSAVDLVSIATILRRAVDRRT
ncbi:MAG: hypothetical protein ACRDVD_01615 [Acidimicrobiia bacterium]